MCQSLISPGRIWPIAWLALLAASGLPATVLAASVGSHSVSIVFQAIDEISVSGNPVLNVNSAVAGSEPQPASSVSATYSISTNGSNRRVSANLDVNLPAEVVMSIDAQAPTTSGTSLGNVQLSTTSTNVVTGISQTAQSNIPISYEMSATVAAGIVPASMRNVTLTLSE